MDYLVFNDLTGAFASTESIVAIYDHADGSRIVLQGVPEEFFSPLKPRELLRRLTIMRYKRENGESTQDRYKTGTSGQTSTL